jgi:hypothetical protein
MRRVKISSKPALCAALKGPGMQFGHNTNVTVGGVMIHVQTEDRGTHSAIIDTTVYHRGQVLHRRKTKYSDLLPLDPEREQALKIRVNEQHATVVDELRSGKLPVQIAPQPTPVQATAVPVPAAAAPPVPVANAAPPAAHEKVLTVDLLNSRTWLTGKQATLYLVVRDKIAPSVVSGARVTARVDGASEKTEVTTTTGADGHAQLQFEMPRLATEEAALVIEASSGEARGQLRFQLKAKPKVPAAG